MSLSRAAFRSRYRRCDSRIRGRALRRREKRERLSSGFRVKPVGERYPRVRGSISRARARAKGEHFCRWYEFAGCARRCARARARSIGSGSVTEGTPLPLPRGHRWPYESALPLAPGPCVTSRCIASVAVHGVPVWARGHRSQTHQDGSQRRESPSRPRVPARDRTRSRKV